MKVVIVIPARYASTRLPGKPLLDINGKPMIQWVYEQAKQSKISQNTLVATDDERIVQVVQAFGGEAMLTPSTIVSGTDRIAVVADRFKADVYVNVQGDEPLIESTVIDQVAQLVVSGNFSMGTAMTPIQDPLELSNPAMVKVVADQKGKALYFSRFPIPYSRAEIPEAGNSFACQRHIGIYAYTWETLLKLRSLPVSALEKGESLEQLRALENGISIGMTQVKTRSIGVDTLEELEKVRRLLV